MKQVYNNSVYRKCDVLLEKSIKAFLNLLDSNTTNIAKDIFVIPTEDIPKK